MEEQNIPQVPIAPIENQPKPKIKSFLSYKWTLIAIFLVLILSLFTGIYISNTHNGKAAKINNVISKMTPIPTVALSTPTPTEVTDQWKTYDYSSDYEYSYSFKYPPNFTQDPPDSGIFDSPDYQLVNQPEYNLSYKNYNDTIGSTEIAGFNRISDYETTEVNDPELISKLTLPAKMTVKTYASKNNNNDYNYNVTVVIKYKNINNNSDVNIVLWCSDANHDISQCKNLMLPILSTLKITKTEMKQLRDIASLDSNNLNLNDWDIKQTDSSREPPYDSQVILINKNTKERKILVNSTVDLRTYMNQKNILTSPLLRNYSAIGLVGASKNTGEVYFKISYEYDGPVFGLNINLLKIREIQSYPSIDSNGGPGRYATSPNGDRIVSLGKYPSASLDLICFNTDSKIFTIRLNPGETFEQKVAQLDSYFDIKWLDQRNIQYKVYKNEAKKYGDVNTFIETRTSQLPDCP